MSVGVDFDFTRWIAARRGQMEQSAREGAAYAYTGERRFRRNLMLARPVTMALEATTRLWRDVARTELLGTAIKVTDQQYPRVFEAAKAVGAALRVRVPVVFAAPNTSMKVKVLGTDDSPHLIVNLDLAEKLDDTELVAAIAHELAHVQNGTLLYTTALHYLNTSAAFFVRWVVQPAIMTLQAWSRRAEVTCDRAALLAVRDLDKTLAAMVKLELGLDKGSAFNADEYLRSLPDVKKGLGKFAELFRSHPYVPKRVQALRLFAGSALYAHVTGQDPTGKPSLTGIDQQDGDIISVFERSTMILLEHHKEAKREIIARFQQLADVADGVGMVTLARDIRTTRIPKLESERFHMVVLGEFNHGKSTFVNALLGQDVLPTGITPTTASINHVVHAQNPTARVVLKSGESKYLDPGQLKEWVTVAGGHADEVAYVELGYPSDLLLNNVVLVDTPGVNDLNEQRAEVTYGYVPRADAVVFLLDAGQALKDSEREFLRSRVLESARDRLIFVLGKMDLLNADERTAVVEYVRQGLAQITPEPVLFPLSAKDWARTQDPQSGMPELMQYLERFLAHDRAQVILDNAAADAARTASYLENNLGVRMRAYDLDLGELEQRIGAVREQLDASKRKLDELHVRIDADATSIKNQVGLDLEAFAKAFVHALPSQIDAVDADDVKAYLPAFIEDKFKEWAELEGAKLAAMLEHLAEEVIAITNENVAAAAATLAERLGPSDTQVEITVDSFKYDVGIYAVGALGTTVMLFVNALAGGLLTLAAPILAIVLKSKIAGDIRVQAKERVPAAVLKAAEAMQPHFDKCIDDFAKRLSEFVSNAGNTLYKGISEILDRTMRERRERSGEIGELRSATRSQIAQVKASLAALRQLRESLWVTEEQPQDN